MKKTLFTIWHYDQPNKYVFINLNKKKKGKK